MPNHTGDTGFLFSVKRLDGDAAGVTSMPLKISLPYIDAYILPSLSSHMNV